MNKLDKDYLDLVQDIITNGHNSDDRTGTGTIKVFGREIRHNMSDGFPLLTSKKMFHKGIFHELLWFIKGDTNIKYLVDNGVYIWVGDAYKNFVTKHEKCFEDARNKFKSIYHTNEPIDCFVNTNILTREEFIEQIKTNDEFAKEWGELGPVYGSQWRNWNGIDQISNLIETLKTNPDSRRMLISAWRVDEVEEMTLPPCHYGFQIYTRKLDLEERRKLVSNELFQLIYTAGDSSTLSHEECDKFNIPRRAISLKYTMRSVDILLGSPFNIASYGLLLLMISQCVNMLPEDLISSYGDTHIYYNQLEFVDELFSRENKYKLPKLIIKNNTTNIFDFKIQDFEVIDYNSHDKMYFPLSN